MRKLIILVILVLIIGGFIIKSSYDLNLKDKDDRSTFVNLFSKWVLKLGHNLVDLTSSAVKQDWSPTEKKNDTKTTN